MKTLYFDVDGILLNFMKPFVDYWNDGLNENLWKGPVLSYNPTTWLWGLCVDDDNLKQINKASEEFHRTHDHLPIMHSNIVEIMKELQKQYKITLVSSYPHKDRRVENLAYHNIPYDSIVCDVHDKVGYIQNAETLGDVVVAIFEDGPHHIDKYLKHYHEKLWAPSCWNYLESHKNDSRIRFYDDPQEWKELLG